MATHRKKETMSKEFHYQADMTFFADDLFDAFEKISAHFAYLSDDETGTELEFVGNSSIKKIADGLAPKDENDE